ncbi:hypothetical protein K502DRAFT_339900 [Neoconidiobolus thromboides FSU 785]|nr:hypothetical protein K502DRAFT_339900 [Neoconidiobolus thromboides FSU 785]
MFILYTFDKGFELSSYDPDCLAAQVYLNLLGVEWVASICNHTEASPSGALPVLNYGTEYISGLNSIIEYLSKLGHTLDSKLSEEDKINSYFMRGYISEKLKDALNYYRYIDEANFINSTRPELGKTLSIASRYTLPGKLVEKAVEDLKKYEQCVEVEKARRKELKISSISLKYLKRIKDDKVLPPLEAKIFESVRNLLKEIETTLGDKKYFFDEQNISTIDVILYAYLSHILYPKLNNNKLSDYIITTHPLLLKYTDNIHSQVSNFQATALPPPSAIFNIKNIGLYFIPTKLTNLFNYWKQPKNQVDQPEIGIEELKLRKSRAHSAIAAVVVFTAYIIFNGLLGAEEEEENDNVNYMPNPESFIQEEVDDVEADD